MNSDIQYRPGDNAVILLKKILTVLNNQTGGTPGNGGGNGGGDDGCGCYILQDKIWVPAIGAGSKYEAGYCIYGLWTVLEPFEGYGEVVGATVVDVDNVMPAVRIVLLNGEPETEFVDQRPPQWAHEDAHLICGFVDVLDSDYYLLGGEYPISAAQVSSKRIVFDCTNGLYAVCLAQSFSISSTESPWTFRLRLLLPAASPPLSP